MLWFPGKSRAVREIVRGRNELCEPYAGSEKMEFGRHTLFSTQKLNIGCFQILPEFFIVFALGEDTKTPFSSSKYLSWKVEGSRTSSSITPTASSSMFKERPVRSTFGLERVFGDPLRRFDNCSKATAAAESRIEKVSRQSIFRTALRGLKTRPRINE